MAKKAKPTGTVVIRASWDYITKALADTSIQVGLAGPPGVGKTHGAVMCRIKSPNKKLARVTHKFQCHSESSPAEALGMYVPVDGSFDWMDGPISTCYAKGGLLVIDEVIEASGPLKTFLYGAMDRGPGGTISYAGRVFEQQPGYQVVATMNGWPDQGGLPQALLDRFDAWFIVTQPTEEQMALLDPDLRDICRDSYDPEVVEDEMEGPDITFRMLMAYQKLRKIMPPEMAVLAAARGNKTLAQSFFEVITMTSDDEEEENVVATAAPVAPSRSPEWTEELHESTDDKADNDDDDWDDE